MDASHDSRRGWAERGFSVVRLLVGTAALSGVVEFTIPRAVATSHLEEAGHRIVKVLQRAKLRAVGEDRCYLIRFNAAARTLQVASKRSTNPCGSNGFVNDGAPQVIDDHDAVAVEATDNPVFDTYGNAATTAKIKLTASNGTSGVITVNDVGRIENPDALLGRFLPP